MIGTMLWINYLAIAIAAGIFFGVGLCALDDAYERGKGPAFVTFVRRLGMTSAGAALVALPGLATLLRMVLGESRGVESPSGLGVFQIAGEIVGRGMQITGGGVAAIIAFTLGVLGLDVLRWRRWHAATLLSAVALISLLITFPLRARHPFFAPRFLGALEPIVWIGVATVVAAVVESRRRELAIVVVTAVVAVFACMGRASVAADDWSMAGRSRLPAATARIAREVKPGDEVVFHPEFNRIVGYYYGLPRKLPFQKALLDDPSVIKPETLGSTQRPERLWLVAGFTSTEDKGLAWLEQQRSEVRAFARWYGRGAEGEKLAEMIEPGDTFVAHFDAAGTGLEVVDDEKLP
jgi:hypothetical protein